MLLSLAQDPPKIYEDEVKGSLVLLYLMEGGATLIIHDSLRKGATEGFLGELSGTPFGEVFEICVATFN